MPVKINSSGGGSVTLTAGSTAVDTTLNLPTAGGTLVANATGTVQNADRQVFNSSGTWTKPSGFSANSPVFIEAWGAGGSGGRGANAGGGGGGGGYNSRWTVLSALGATEAVTVGAGGVARSTNQTGATGGNSSLGSQITAFGGAGGSSWTNPNIFSGGNGGGQLSAGSSDFPGRPTFVSIVTSACGPIGRIVFQGQASGGANNENDAFIHGGGGVQVAVNLVGASSVWGGGGGGGFGGATSTTAGTSSFGGNGGAGGATGTAGTQPGGGGGGSTSGNSGAGGAGRVIITVFPGA